MIRICGVPEKFILGMNIVQINQFFNGSLWYNNSNRNGLLRQLEIVYAQCYHNFCYISHIRNVKIFLLPLHNTNNNLQKRYVNL